MIYIFIYLLLGCLCTLRAEANAKEKLSFPSFLFQVVLWYEIFVPPYLQVTEYIDVTVIYKLPIHLFKFLRISFLLKQNGLLIDSEVSSSFYLKIDKNFVRFIKNEDGEYELHRLTDLPKIFDREGDD